MLSQFPKMTPLWEMHRAGAPQATPKAGVGIQGLRQHQQTGRARGRPYQTLRNRGQSSK